MKNISIKLLFLTLFLLPAYLYAENLPKIELVDSPWDFGQVKKDQIAEKSFFITNEGEGKLSIKSVSSCCGYRLKELSSWKIAPGERSEITILCNGKIKNIGKDEKKFTIKSNDPVNPELKAPVRSYIVE